MPQSIQKNDVIEVIQKRKVGTRSVAVKMWDKDGIHHELNYWIVHSVEDLGDHYYISAVPDLTRGPYHCGHACMNLDKAGRDTKKFSPEWKVVDHIKPHYDSAPWTPQPHDPAFDLLF